MKTEPISFRPSEELDSRLNRMRERTGIPKSRLVEQLADEAERCRRYPGLAFRGPDLRRRAWVIGSPFDVWEIVEAWQDLAEDEAKVREQLDLTPRQLKLSLSYYREFTDEIDAALRLQRRPVEALATAYPFIAVVE